MSGLGDPPETVCDQGYPVTAAFTRGFEAGHTAGVLMGRRLQVAEATKRDLGDVTPEEVATLMCTANQLVMEGCQGSVKGPRWQATVQALRKLADDVEIGRLPVRTGPAPVVRPPRTRV